MPRDASRSQLERSQNEANVLLARRFFFCGLACLPWLWIVNLFYFRAAICSSDASPELRTWLRRSLLGVIAFTVLFSIWIALIQTQWEAWGASDVLVTTPADASNYWWLDNS